MGLLDWFRPPSPPDAEAFDLVERAVTAIAPIIRTVPGYQRRLAPAVRSARDYCGDIAARIPGPFKISREAFARDPLVHALFASADDIDQMLGRSQCVREHLVGANAPLTGQCCALLGMRHREKSGFGARLEGQMVHFDQPQRTLYFTDHTLAEPAPNLAAARQHLRDVMFDSLVASVAAHVAEVRNEHDALHQDQVIEAASQRLGRQEQVPTRRLAELQQRLRASSNALQPANLLETLADCLTHPESYLRLDDVTLAVDRSGVINDTAPDDGAGDTLQFTELTSRDKRRWVVILADIEREEARRAVEGLNEARRYIVI